MNIYVVECEQGLYVVRLETGTPQCKTTGNIFVGVCAITKPMPTLSSSAPSSSHLDHNTYTQTLRCIRNQPIQRGHDQLLLSPAETSTIRYDACL